MSESVYYVAKQAERQFGVYYQGIYGSRLHKMFRTRREAVAEARKMNAFVRIERQIREESVS